MKRATLPIAACALALTICVTLGTRLFGPHDLYEKDQPKTMAYTADVLLHGRWALPRDVIYQPATKPPFYNWIDAAVVMVTGSWDEWALKFPSLLGTLATAVVVYIMARRSSPPPLEGGGGGRGPPRRRSDSAVSRPSTADIPLPNPLPQGERGPEAAFFGLLAAAVWFGFGSDPRHGSVLRLSYLARPDMLQCAFLTGAWACAVVAIDRPTVRRAAVPGFGFWLCVTGAALTKGPAAAMAIAFAVVYAFVAPNAGRRRRNALKLWPAVGVPLLVVCVGGWLLAAYRQDPVHVRTVIFGAEIADRLTSESPEGIRKPVYYAVMWFVTKAMPFGGVALVGLIVWAVRPRRWPGMTPVTVWLVIVLACLSLPAGKRMDYILPAYPPAAVLAAGVLIAVARRLRIPRAVLPLLPVACAAVFANRFRRHFQDIDQHGSDRTVVFVEQVLRTIDLGRERPLVIVRGKHPITTLLGQHQGSYLTRADLAAASYVICPEQPDLPSLVRSEPVPAGFETVENRPTVRMGLYYFATGTAPVDRLVEMQRAVGQWTRDENPYHAPDTVYRER